jgi:hypothetical protein
MAFHLEGPWLSTIGKKKGKIKWASADHKRKAEEQAQSWEELKTKYAPKKSVFNKSYSNTKMPKLVIPEGRGTDHIRSARSGVGTTAKVESPMYTGTLIKGIAQTHKSNAIPVIDEQHIIDIARMRR